MTSQKKSLLTGRNKKILDYRETHTLKETGIEFGISSERVRQIEMFKTKNRCEIHHKFYTKACPFCVAIRNFVHKIEPLSRKQLINLAKREAKNKRKDYLSVERRRFIAIDLYYQYKYSFTYIGNLLGRHRTSIKHLIETIK